MSTALFNGSGFPSGPCGLTYIKPICTAAKGWSSSRSPVYLSLVNHSVSLPQNISFSGAQISGRPPPNPKTLPPIDSIATLPVKINKSAQLILFPYFFLIGHNNLRALSRLPLSGQLLSGAYLCAPVPPPPLPSVVR